jgi:hypothetical protein
VEDTVWSHIYIAVNRHADRSPQQDCVVVLSLRIIPYLALNELIEDSLHPYQEEGVRRTAECVNVSQETSSIIAQRLTQAVYIE